jgi:hypothetical protein
VALGAFALAGTLLFWRATRAPEDPSATVSRFFAAVERHDCEAARKLVAGALGRSLARPEGCQTFLDEYASHRMKFGGALEARADGRDPDARLVRARLSLDARERTHVLRVERARDAGGWRLTRF